MKKIVSLLVLAAFAAPAAFGGQSAKVSASDAYYQVKSISVTEEIPTAAEIAAGYLQPEARPELNTGIWDDIVGGDWNAIVLVGKQLIEIIKAGQPVVNIKRDAVHAIPAGVTDWQMLSGWQMPMTKVFTYKIVNGLNMTPVELRLKVSAMWGGSAGGKGKYLSNITVVPESTYVGWGWNLDIWTENGTPVNSGSTEAPVAALTFDIRYKVKTYFNEMQGTKDYYLTGEGKLVEMD